ncbi:hypothetical protein ACRXB1_29705, partial [Caballeronia sp. M23-90]
MISVGELTDFTVVSGNPVIARVDAIKDIEVRAYSTQSEWPFHGKVNRDSKAKRTGIPRHREQTERSDAGPLL